MVALSLARRPLSPAEADEWAHRFKAVADPTRLRLLGLVAAGPDGEACVCDLTDPVNLSQPTVSHHLRVLVEAGLLTRQQRGRWAYYRTVPAALAALAHVLDPHRSPPVSPAASR
ncbi:winged helix-turn-helix transcriptional regulator [Nakamurella flava]|uniref:Winged helix-turn-helix transcriptional regulator n=1 Tax=Nakamurella flava TaxID=2576308 RepID=A0A4U6QDY7_9ACTN|nr:metalloregulator ArsR/SmtB family transcription factor [Nakamurella flava]TKV58270.1 winged helix-turn-helix transcriptional regulator [Nakamurella flava]